MSTFNHPTTGRTYSEDAIILPSGFSGGKGEDEIDNEVGVLYGRTTLICNDVDGPYGFKEWENGDGCAVFVDPDTDIEKVKEFIDELDSVEFGTIQFRVYNTKPEGKSTENLRLLLNHPWCKGYVIYASELDDAVEQRSTYRRLIDGAWN